MMSGPHVPPLARTMLDRAAHHRRDPDWLAQAFKTGLVLVVDTAAGGRAPARDNSDGSASLVLLDAAAAPEGDRHFLGVDPDGTPLFTVDAPLPALSGVSGVTLREVGHRLDDRDAGLFSAAAALVNWHVSHLFSPRSGKPTTITEAGWSRTDPDGKQMWPRTDPAMIVLIHDGVAGPGGRCLLGRNAQWVVPDGSKRFSTLAGFVEPGESAEAAVHREVLEEVGVRVHELRYEGSQAWPYPGSLMLGFTARADASDPISVDPDEIAEARWFTRTEIKAIRAGEYRDPDTGVSIGLPMSASIALYLIETWLAFPED
ncbi:NAD(+) diphosphatase [Actinoplanes sp. NPDC049265]|uniref:NAD(+) diphosphatase n=1 Tax=Actinoplanes sp. NPDC049265 TaxID=3363902 RepID=UPI0037185C2D